MAELRGRLGKLPGKRFAGLTVSAADDFAYTDPIDGSTASGQGMRVFFAENARAVLRLSGTGTVGATLRVYLERFEDDPARPEGDQIGRASGRERVWQYVSISVGAGTFNKKLTDRRV